MYAFPKVSWNGTSIRFSRSAMFGFAYSATNKRFFRKPFHLLDRLTESVRVQPSLHFCAKALFHWRESKA